MHEMMAKRNEEQKVYIDRLIESLLQNVCMDTFLFMN